MHRNSMDGVRPQAAFHEDPVPGSQIGTFPRFGDRCADLWLPPDGRSASVPLPSLPAPTTPADNCAPRRAVCGLQQIHLVVLHYSWAFHRANFAHGVVCMAFADCAIWLVPNGRLRLFQIPATVATPPFTSLLLLCRTFFLIVRAAIKWFLLLFLPSLREGRAAAAAARGFCAVLAISGSARQ